MTQMKYYGKYWCCLVHTMTRTSSAYSDVHTDSWTGHSRVEHALHEARHEHADRLAQKDHEAAARARERHVHKC
jgi:hypothetical protein